MEKKEDLHDHHRSGWHTMYQSRQAVPRHFNKPAPPPPKEDPPTPPPSPPRRTRDDDIDEFMSFTGVTDRNLAARLVEDAFAQGKDLRQAIREYLESLDRMKAYGQPQPVYSQPDATGPWQQRRLNPVNSWP